MNIGIIVLSKTGNTLLVAQRIADALSAAGHTASIARVTVAADKPGAPGSHQLVDAPDPTPYDAVVFGAPVWGFSLADVMKTYLAQIPALGGKKTVCFVTQHFPKPWMGGNRALRQMREACAQKAANVTLTGVINWSAPAREAQIAELVAHAAAL